jgi:hypothetical protein
MKFNIRRSIPSFYLLQYMVDTLIFVLVLNTFDNYSRTTTLPSRNLYATIMYTI